MNAYNSDIPLSSGSKALDVALKGGYPLGNAIEIHGDDNTGKSTLGLMAIRECQKRNSTSILVNSDESFDPKYAEAHGINTKELLVLNDYAENVIDMLSSLIPTGAIGLIVIDSLNSLLPKSESQCMMGEEPSRAQHEVISMALNHLTDLCNKHQTVLLIVSQIRQIETQEHGFVDTTPSKKTLGKKLSHRIYCSHLTPISLTPDSEITGFTIHQVVELPLGKKAQTKISFDHILGMDIEADFVNAGLVSGIFHEQADGSICSSSALIGRTFAEAAAKFQNLNWKAKLDNRLIEMR